MEKKSSKKGAKAQLTVHMSHELHDKFMKLALSQNKTRSAVLLDLVQSYCDD